MNMPYLQQARIARGLSLENLADAIENMVSRQTLQNYESGKTKPSALALKAIAHVLGVHVADLLRGPEFHCEHIAYRKKVRLPKKEAASIEARVIQEINRRCWVQARCLPDSKIEPIRGLFKNISALAEIEEKTIWLRKKWGLGTSPIRNLADELESHSIHVIAISAHQDFDGLSSVAIDSRKHPFAYAVAVKQETSLERQRFSMAHELGHILFDSDDEALAHAFAGAFLAPKEELILMLGQSRNRVKKEEWLALKRYFGMSMQALIRRARDCNIIQDDSYRFWNTVLRRITEEGDTIINSQCGAVNDWMLRTVMRGYAEGILNKIKAEELLGRSIADESLELKSRKDIRAMSPEKRRHLMEKQATSATNYYLSPEFRAIADPGEVYDAPLMS